jgi:Mrp family chromosome partitioning ATPase
LKKFFKRGGGAGDAGADQQNLFNNMKQKAEKIIKVQGVQPPAENQETQSAGTLIGSRNNISRTVAIVSGKGGVGKSTVSSLLASGLIMRGYRVGILDADITGPSIPRAFGLKGGYMARNDFGIIPRRTEMDIKIMSLNLFLEDENDPVVWRGPRISGAVREFYSQVDWGRLDFLLLDMPPGTGDIAITVLQELPLQGAVIVTTPRILHLPWLESLQNDVQHSIPVLGMVENFKTGVCPQCGHDFSIYTDLGVENWCRRTRQVFGRSARDAFLGSMPTRVQ